MKDPKMILKQYKAAVRRFDKYGSDVAQTAVVRLALAYAEAMNIN